MDPKDNAGTKGTNDAQNNSSTPVDGTQAPELNGAPSLSPDGFGGQASDQAAPGGADQGTRGVEVDLSGTPATSTDGTDPATRDAPFSSASTPGTPQFGTTQDAVTPPSGQPGSAPGTPTTPDLGLTGDTNAAPGGASMPPISTEPSAPGQTTGSPIPAADQQPGGLSPTAPVPAHGADKKTIVVLGAVAVVLIAAIIVLFLM